MSDHKKAVPFGLEKGVKLDQLSFEIEEIGPCVYMTVNPPKPHSSFSSYILRVAPCSGLYWIKGVSNDINTDSFGSILKSKADNMIDRLERIYGEAEKVSFLSMGTIWDEPRDFMNGLLNNEIHYGARWSSASHDLPEGLEGIFLGVNANSSNSGYMFIEYEFDNHNQAEREIEELEDDAL